MTKYHSHINRIVSIISLAAFLLTSCLPVYALEPASKLRQVNVAQASGESAEIANALGVSQQTAVTTNAAPNAADLRELGRNPQWFADRLTDVYENGMILYAIDPIVNELLDEVRKAVPPENRDSPIFYLAGPVREYLSRVDRCLSGANSSIREMLSVSVNARLAREIQAPPTARQYDIERYPFAVNIYFTPYKVPFSGLDGYQKKYGTEVGFSLPSLSEQRGARAVPLSFHAAVKVAIKSLMDPPAPGMPQYVNFIDVLRQAAHDNNIAIKDVESFEVWPVKEGGIGLVLRLSVKLRSRQEPVVLVDIVSKDLGPSADRLRSEGAILGSWCSKDTRVDSERQVVKPYLVTSLGITPTAGSNEFLGNAVCLIGEWFEGYYESHVITVDSRPRFLIVKKWTGISGPEGTLLSAEETSEVWKEIARLRTFYSDFRRDAQGIALNVTSPVFAINDGPFVIALDDQSRLRRTSDGRPDVKITSVSGVATYPAYYLPMGLAVDAAVFRRDPSTPHSNGNWVYWNQPLQAIEAFVQGVVDAAVISNPRQDQRASVVEQAHQKAFSSLRLAARFAPDYSRSPRLVLYNLQDRIPREILDNRLQQVIGSFLTSADAQAVGQSTEAKSTGNRISLEEDRIIQGFVHDAIVLIEKNMRAASRHNDRLMARIGGIDAFSRRMNEFYGTGIYIVDRPDLITSDAGSLLTTTISVDDGQRAIELQRLAAETAGPEEFAFLLAIEFVRSYNLDTPAMTDLAEIIAGPDAWEHIDVLTDIVLRRAGLQIRVDELENEINGQRQSLAEITKGVHWFRSNRKFFYNLLRAASKKLKDFTPGRARMTQEEKRFIDTCRNYSLQDDEIIRLARMRISDLETNLEDICRGSRPMVYAGTHSISPEIEMYGESIVRVNILEQIRLWRKQVYGNRKAEMNSQQSALRRLEREYGIKMAQETRMLHNTRYYQASRARFIRNAVLWTAGAAVASTGIYKAVNVWEEANKREEEARKQAELERQRKQQAALDQQKLEVYRAQLKIIFEEKSLGERVAEKMRYVFGKDGKDGYQVLREMTKVPMEDDIIAMIAEKGGFDISVFKGVCERFNLNPLIAIGIMCQETDNLDSNNITPNRSNGLGDGKGLMGLMDAGGADIWRREFSDQAGVNPYNPHNPNQNVRVGCAEIAAKIEDIRTRCPLLNEEEVIHFALACYNGGPAYTYNALGLMSGMQTPVSETEAKFPQFNYTFEQAMPYYASKENFIVRNGKHLEPFDRIITTYALIIPKYAQALNIISGKQDWQQVGAGFGQSANAAGESIAGAVGGIEGAVSAATGYTRVYWASLRFQIFHAMSAVMFRAAHNKVEATKYLVRFARPILAQSLEDINNGRAGAAVYRMRMLGGINADLETIVKTGLGRNQDPSTGQDITTVEARAKFLYRLLDQGLRENFDLNFAEHCASSGFPVVMIHPAFGPVVAPNLSRGFNTSLRNVLERDLRTQIVESGILTQDYLFQRLPKPQDLTPEHLARGADGLFFRTLQTKYPQAWANLRSAIEETMREAVRAGVIPEDFLDDSIVNLALQNLSAGIMPGAGAMPGMQKIYIESILSKAQIWPIFTEDGEVDRFVTLPHAAHELFSKIYEIDVPVPVMQLCDENEFNDAYINAHGRDEEKLFGDTAGFVEVTPDGAKFYLRIFRIASFWSSVYFYTHEFGHCALIEVANKHNIKLPARSVIKESDFPTPYNYNDYGLIDEGTAENLTRHFCDEYAKYFPVMEYWDILRRSKNLEPVVDGIYRLGSALIEPLIDRRVDLPTLAGVINGTTTLYEITERAATAAGAVGDNSFALIQNFISSRGEFSDYAIDAGRSFNTGDTWILFLNHKTSPDENLVIKALVGSNLRGESGRKKMERMANQAQKEQNVLHRYYEMFGHDGITALREIGGRTGVVDSDTGICYVFMQPNPPGADLFTRLRRGERFTPAEVRQMGLQIGKVLGNLHSMRVCAADIKPENIWICDDGRVILNDFGGAYLMKGHGLGGYDGKFQVPENFVGQSFYDTDYEETIYDDPYKLSSSFWDVDHQMESWDPSSDVFLLAANMVLAMTGSQFDKDANYNYERNIERFLSIAPVGNEAWRNFFIKALGGESYRDGRFRNAAEFIQAVEGLPAVVARADGGGTPSYALPQSVTSVSRGIDDLMFLYPSIDKFLAGLKPGARVLFIGPGRGYEILGIKKRYPDLSLNFQSIGLQNLFSDPDLTQSLGFHQGDINAEGLSFYSPGEFDAVIMGGAVMMYIEDKARLVDEIYGKLNVGGTAFIDLYGMGIAQNADVAGALHGAQEHSTVTNFFSRPEVNQYGELTVEFGTADIAGSDLYIRLQTLRIDKKQDRASLGLPLRLINVRNVNERRHAVYVASIASATGAEVADEIEGIVADSALDALNPLLRRSLTENIDILRNTNIPPSDQESGLKLLSAVKVLRAGLLALLKQQELADRINHARSALAGLEDQLKTVVVSVAPQESESRMFTGYTPENLERRLVLENIAFRKKVQLILEEKGYDTEIAKSVAGAILRSQRHLFVPIANSFIAYDGTDFEIDSVNHDFISSPHVVAETIARLLTELENPRETSVLVLDNDNGWQAAVLSSLVKEVYVVVDASKAEEIAVNMQKVGAENVRVIVGDVEADNLELPEPVNGMIVSSFTTRPSFRPQLLKNIAQGGVIVIPLRKEPITVPVTPDKMPRLRMDIGTKTNEDRITWHTFVGLPSIARADGNPTDAERFDKILENLDATDLVLIPALLFYFNGQGGIFFIADQDSILESKVRLEMARFLAAPAKSVPGSDIDKAFAYVNRPSNAGDFYARFRKIAQLDVENNGAIFGGLIKSSQERPGSDVMPAHTLYQLRGSEGTRSPLVDYLHIKGLCAVILANDKAVADQEQIKLTGRGFVEENIMQIVVPDSGDLSSIAAINDFVARIKAWAGEREIVLVVNRTGMEQQALDANLTAAYPSTVIVTDITDENWKDIRTSL